MTDAERQRKRRERHKPATKPKPAPQTDAWAKVGHLVERLQLEGLWPPMNAATVAEIAEAIRLALDPEWPAKANAWRAENAAALAEQNERLKVERAAARKKAEAARKAEATREAKRQRQRAKEQMEDEFEAELDKLAKVLAMLGSPEDHEVLVAARRAEKLREKLNAPWRALLDGRELERMEARRFLEEAIRRAQAAAAKEMRSSVPCKPSR